MNPQLQTILNIICEKASISDEEKADIEKSLKAFDKELEITAFRLQRTEKVKRTTSVLLEETIEELEQKRKVVEDSKAALEESLEELKATQIQLIQQEKLASLGQLTAGIAHEIKNPLNFVNNFSEVSLELLEELREEVKSERGKQMYDADLILEILDDIEANLRKIHEHGTRADSIVKSMLMHSRGGSGEMEPTDLNALIKEYVNLAFHGMRANKDPINAEIDLQLEKNLKPIPLIVEDFSRVILNICNNAFDAMKEKAKAEHKKRETSQPDEQYYPKLTVRTKAGTDKILIEIEDNGPGIPKEIRDKILQPFFTTKKGTQGTGLGLSITHDIIKAHGGSIKIESSENGAALLITLPV
jgi:signal transduction histidine kinase